MTVRQVTEANEPHEAAAAPQDDVAALVERCTMGRSWLVTGVAGFIGSHLLEALLLRGARVVGVDDLSTGHRSNLDDVKARVGAAAWSRARIEIFDINDTAALRSAAQGCEFLNHQAAIGSVPRSVVDPAGTHRANVDGFLSCIEVAREVGVRAFVYASSSSVYGDHPAMPKREPELGTPLSPYAASKRMDEVMSAAWSSSYAMRTAGLRYFNVVGPRQDPEGAYAAVIPRWLAEMLAGKQPTIFGDGETSRDFCPIANVVQANLRAAARLDTGQCPSGQAFNVALGGRTTLRQLFDILRDALASRGLARADLEPRYEDFRAGDIRHSLADISAAQRDLAYQPEMSLAAGLEETVAWYVQHSGAGTRS